MSEKVAKRTRLNIKVDYRRSYARDGAQGDLKNISITGAFLTHGNESLKPGDKLSIIFKVSGRERTIPAAVVWSNSQGSGIKFIPANNRDVQIVDDLIYFVQEKKSDQKEILSEILSKVA